MKKVYSLDFAGRKLQVELGEIAKQADGAAFVLKAVPAGTEDLAEAFQILTRLSPLLSGAVPEPAACFQEDGTTYLLRAFFSLGDGINSYGLYLTLSWLETIALVGVGLGALDAYRQKYAATASLFLLLGLTGVLNLLSMLAQQYTTRNYFTPCLFLLALNLFWVAADRKLRLMGLCGAGLFALVLLLQAFTTLPFLPQLAVCYGCLLMCFTLVKQQPQL